MEKVDTNFPLDWHPDGTPIFLRGDIIRDPRPIGPDHGSSYDYLILPEHKHLRPEGRLNLYVLPPNSKTQEFAGRIWIGKSYPDPRHGKLFGRIVQGLDSTCRIILQRWNEPGKINDFVMLTLHPLQFAVVPPNYETVLLNSSSTLPARFIELYAKEESRNIETLKKFNGAGYLLKSSGILMPNDKYDELPIPRIHPGLEEFKFLQKRPIYEMFTSFPKGFDFIDPPKAEFFSGSL